MSTRAYLEVLNAQLGNGTAVSCPPDGAFDARPVALPALAFETALAALARRNHTLAAENEELRRQLAERMEAA